MPPHRGRSTSPQKPLHSRNDSSLSDSDFLPSRQIEAFSRTVQATASQLITSSSSAFASTNDQHGADPYHSALSTVHRSLRRPAIQRSVFSFAQANPRELIKRNFNTTEMEHRALTYIPQDLIRTAPRVSNAFSLFEGFRASLPDVDEDDDGGAVAGRRKRRGSKKLLEAPGGEEDTGSPQLAKMKREKDRLDHRLEMMGIRKTMCAGEIREIDGKISNLNTMRRVVLDRLAGLEGEETQLERTIGDLAEQVEALQEQLDDEAAMAKKSPVFGAAREDVEAIPEEDEDHEGDMSASFMSESIYVKLPQATTEKQQQQQSPRSRKRGRAVPKRTISMPVLHEHMQSGSSIRSMQAHGDTITALDFDAPFGTLVTAALDDTVRVWDLSAGRCIGMLEGHLSSVRCLQVEDSLVATGSMDASIRLWDLSQADYSPHTNTSSSIHATAEAPEDGDGDDELFTTVDAASPTRSQASVSAVQIPNATADCALFTLSAHVDSVTALHFRGSTLVSGSADKTLRQWDLGKGRCVQTLDVLWAAAQAHTSTVQAAPSSASSGLPGGLGSNDAAAGSWWRPSSGRLAGGASSGDADFVGAVQVFDAALACGTADGMVRLWDLRSGQVHRSLVGHTGAVTALQFDDVYLVTGSRDRSIRVSSYFGLRTGMFEMSRLMMCGRSGTCERELYTTLSRTTHRSARCSLMCDTLYPRPARAWSKSTTRRTGDTGIVVSVLRRPWARKGRSKWVV